MFDIPIKYWAEPTFRGIGEALGSDVVVDIDGGRIQVTLDGFKPLVFESFLEFGGGEETRVKFRYERLFGFCKICHSLSMNPRFVLKLLVRGVVIIMTHLWMMVKANMFLVIRRL